MRNILTIFMVQRLLLSETQATEVYHIFVASCYLIPLFGGYLADRFFGKYSVILWLSVVYCVGHGVIAVFENKTGLYWGLGLIALGSGGIKPCVSAFVGDQFGSGEKKNIQRVYNLFYWIINLGSASSALLTPRLLKYFGPSVAFGVPGVLMLIAVIIFWLGRHKYIKKPPRGKNPHGAWAIFMSSFRSSEKHLPFWDRALAFHPKEEVEGVKSLFSIMKIFFIAVPVFWALFDQHGSTWILQARKMDPNFLGIHWQPSEIQALNPFMVMGLIPLFIFVVYPLIQKFYDFTPLRRMCVGMVVAAFSFVQVGVLEFLLDQGMNLSIAWQFFPYLTITVAEVMISITGLEFAYTQAPPSMKSVVMSLYLLTTFLGNVYVAFITKINIFQGGAFFMFFAFLMMAVALIFGLLARSYRVRNWS